jgi:hypothetical protein
MAPLFIAPARLSDFPLRCLPPAPELSVGQQFDLPLFDFFPPQPRLSGLHKIFNKIKY